MSDKLSYANYSTQIIASPIGPGCEIEISDFVAFDANKGAFIPMNTTTGLFMAGVAMSSNSIHKSLAGSGVPNSNQVYLSLEGQYLCIFNHPLSSEMLLKRVYASKFLPEHARFVSNKTRGVELDIRGATSAYVGNLVEIVKPEPNSGQERLLIENNFDLGFVRINAAIAQGRR